MVPDATSTSNSSPSIFGNSGPADGNQAHMMREMAKERSVLRQKEIVDETNQLLDLAKQLKEAVDKTDRDQLSLNVVNTAAEIEKLAKSVKQKMRDGD
jgi:ATP-dependent helicase/DNAse subunit B